MNRKSAQRLLLLILIAAGISACGRSEPNATQIPFTPTFTPTPAAPIVIHIAQGRPGAPGLAPANVQAMLPSAGIQPHVINVISTPVAIESPSGNLADLNITRGAEDGIAKTTAATTTAASAAVTSDNTEMIVAAQSESTAPSATAVTQSEPGGQAPDLAVTAAELGVSEEVLRAALGEPGQGPPDLAFIAAELGVTEEALVAALGEPQSGQRPAGGPPPNAP